MRAKMFGLVATSMAIAACGDLSGPKSPETPINVTATLIAGNAVQITWAPSPQSDGVISYNILRNGTKIGESTTTSYVDTQAAEKTTYKYTVSANCTSGVLSDPSPETAAATVTTADVTAPRITVVNPLPNATGVSTFATVTATFNEAMDPATINSTTFNLKVTTSGQNIVGAVTYNQTTRVAEFTPSFQLPSLTSITATVTAGAKDLAGNALSLTPGSPGIWAFTTSDQTPPTIISVSPTSGAVGVPANTSVAVTFSEAMDASTINGTNINLRLTSSGASVAGSVNYNTTTRVATFTPSSPLATPVSYTLTVLAAVKDLAGNQMTAAFQSTFTTADLTPPTVVSTVPTNLATGVPNNTLVSATFSKPMDATTISGTTFTLKVTATSAAVAGTVAYNAATNTATFTPSAPLASITTYTATITTGAKDTNGNAVAANFNWTFSTADIVPPTVLTVLPANNATNVLTNTTVSITFSEGMDATTINTTNITVKNTATSALVAGVVSYNAGTHVATFTPNVSLANGTGYTVTVTTGVKDAAGNAMASQFTSVFSTAAAADTTPPFVVATAPPDAQTQVGISTIITATFSEAMNASTIDGTTFTLKTTSGGTPVAGTVTYNPATFVATFTLSSALANSTNYTATITTGVKDVSGNAMAANKVWAFTTIADNTPPIVSSVTPTNAATNVAISTTVTATFNEAMDATTITGTTFTLKTTSGSVAVAGTVSYNAGTRVATFTPTSPLGNNTNYTATITTGVKDAAGNALGANNVWAFTTIPDTTPPIVASTSPTDNATSVAISAVVTATFSEAMDATTITTITFTVKTTSGGVPVLGNVTYDAGTKTATFTPTPVALATNTVYTATITTGVKDTAGNAMAANKVWAFTTVP